MLFNNRRVEEELERIRKANLPPPKADEEVALIASEAADGDEDENPTIVDDYIEPADIGFTAKDILAMIIAAFSIILPYAAIFIIMTIIFVYFFFR
ncbi:MAG: hypothetical protein FWD38_02710 [Oscillospiraceae bacterium]|nr:hypothetical protein [Oscillospiraceae bacterium]